MQFNVIPQDIWDHEKEGTRPSWLEELDTRDLPDGKSTIDWLICLTPQVIILDIILYIDTTLFWIGDDSDGSRDVLVYFVNTSIIIVNFITKFIAFFLKIQVI